MCTCSLLYMYDCMVAFAPLVFFQDSNRLFLEVGAHDVVNSKLPSQSQMHGKILFSRNKIPAINSLFLSKVLCN